MTRRRPSMPFVISSPSGGGKTTLVRRALRVLPRLRYSVSYTTRPPRVGEVNGRDYHFLGEADFQEMVAQGRFAEWARVHGHHYGTDHRVLDQGLADGCDMILDIDTQGAQQIRKSREDAVFVFVVPPSWDILESRLRSRSSDDPEAIRRRLLRAREEVAEYTWYDYLVVNDDLEVATSEIVRIIQAEKLRVRHVEPDWIAHLLKGRP